MKNIHPRLGAAVLPLALVATLAACGGTTDSAPTPAATTGATSAASPVTMADGTQATLNAIATTRGKGTAQATFAVQSQTTLDGNAWTNEAEGGLDLANGLGRIGWMSNTSPGVTVVLTTADGDFVRVGGGEADGDGQWFALADGQTTPLLAASDVFRGMEEVTYVVNDEAEGVDPGTAYTAVIELDHDGVVAYAQGMGISTEDPAVLDTADGGEVVLTVVVGDDGAVAQVLRSLRFTWSGGDASASSNVRFTEFGTSVDLTAPPADAVQPAPESQQ